MSYILSYVYGQSMFPTLKHKDKILIKKMPIPKVKVRDIIVYYNNYYNISHRVIKIIDTPDGLIFYTRGDFDRIIEKINEDQILGKVVGVYRKEKLKLFSLENSFFYFLILNILSLCKDLLRKAIEEIYSFVFIRKVIKLLFPLEVKFFFIEDITQNENFKSFYNSYPFPTHKYIPSFGILAIYKNIPVGKLWILDDKKGNYFLYGPYVKILYRVRRIGSNLIKKGLDSLRNKETKNNIYAFILYDKALILCFKKLNFFLEKEIENNLLLYKQVFQGILS